MQDVGKFINKHLNHRNQTNMKDLLIKLKEARRELLLKRAYMAEHNFKKEQEHITTKLDVIEEIMYIIEDVVNDKKKGIEVNFNFK